IETVRCGLADRGLERGVRFIIAADFLDDMWIDLLFNRLGRNPERILDRERGARTMCNDSDAVYPRERRAAVFLVAHLFLNCLKRFLREESPSHPHLAFDQFVFEPFENGVADRFAGLENDVA